MMHNPPQPGEVLREDVIAELGLSVTEATERPAMLRFQSLPAGWPAAVAVRPAGLEQAARSFWLTPLVQAEYPAQQPAQSAAQYQARPTRPMRQPKTR